MKIFVKLLLLCILLYAGSANSEDIDIFRPGVDNNAMMVLDTSGSMSYPVYDQRIDYAGIMGKLIDDGSSIDENDCRNGSTPVTHPWSLSRTFFNTRTALPLIMGWYSFFTWLKTSRASSKPMASASRWIARYETKQGGPNVSARLFFHSRLRVCAQSAA